MKILWLSPWLRSLSRVHVEALADLGHDVVLVTSDQHPESGPPRPYELVLRPHPKTAATWPEFVPAWRTTRRFDADVVVTELVRDPRWLLLAGRRPRVTLVHDDRPHDASEHRPRWERALFDRWADRSAAVVAFSRYVADATGTANVVPLTSDLDDRRVPSPASERRDFVIFGRLNAYKNLAVSLDAWRRHVDGPSWQGDELLIIGEGELPAPLPPHARRLDGRFTYDDVVPLLSGAKAAIVHYRIASQSGVQLLAMQLGVTPIVSDVGALPEFLPPGERALGVDDVSGVAATLNALAEPSTALRRGAVAREHYLAHYAAPVAATALARILAKVAE